MHDDRHDDKDVFNPYLWDRSGEPDPQIQKLEALLSEYRQEVPAPEFPQRGRVLLFRRVAVSLAAAAAVLLAVSTLVWQPGQPGPAWGVAPLEGTPLVGSQELKHTGSIAEGQYLVTDEKSRARIDVGLIGQVYVEPSSSVAMRSGKPNDHRLALDRGKIEARIWAPPRLFFVDTPSAVAVDLGCRYTLEVDSIGAGFLHVLSGWVAFETAGRESFIPEGAMCATRPGPGPGTPYFEDASAELITALGSLDFDQLAPEQRAQALNTVLRTARQRDALTLWHLLTRTQGEERARVYDRLAELLPPPAGVTRQGVLAGDREMIDQWWTLVDPRAARFWRFWKGNFPGSR